MSPPKVIVALLFGLFYRASFKMVTPDVLSRSAARAWKFEGVKKDAGGKQCQPNPNIQEDLIMTTDAL